MSTIPQIVNDPDFAKLSVSDQQTVLSHFDPGFAKVSASEFPHVVASMQQPAMPKPPIPQELQPSPAVTRGSEAFGESIVGKLHQMGEMVHDLATSVSTGDWKGLQQKYPPTGSVSGALKAGYGAYNPVEVKTTPAGQVDVPATIGATLGNVALIAAPLAEEVRGLAQEGAGAPAATPQPAGPSGVRSVAAKAARFGSDVVSPDITGLLSPRLAHAQRVLGKIADALEPEATAAPAPTPGAPPTTPAPTGGDWLARQYGYKGGEAEAIKDVGQTVWDEIKARGPQGLAQGRPVGAAPPPTQPPPAPAAPATAPAEVPAEAAPAAPPPAAEAAPAAPMPATATLPTRNEIAQQLPANFRDYAHMKEVLGEDRADQIISDQYSAMRRAQATAEGRIVGTDQAALRDRGYSQETIDAMKPADAQAILSKPAEAPAAPAAAPAEAPAPAAPSVTEQLQKSLAETPAAAPAAAPTLADMRARVEQADLAPAVKAQVGAAVESLMQKGDPASVASAQQVLQEAMPEAGRPTWREEWQQRWQDKLDAYDAKLAEMGTKRYAGFDPKALPELTDLGRLLLERGLGEFDEWSKAMLQQLGTHVRPYLQDVWREAKTGASETLDYKDNISTRTPSGKKLVSSENPYTNQLSVSTDAILRDPKLAAKISDAVQGKTELTEPQMNDRKQDGGRKYATAADFKDAHDQWQLNKDNQYVGTKAIGDDPKAVFDSFKDQVKRNLIKLYNMVPDNIRKITSQWYDTARNEVVNEATARGLENRQVAAVYASLSPQKDWFMNRSLATRLLDIWRDQQDATFDDKMREKVAQLTEGGKNEDLKDIVASGDLEGKKFSQMNTEEKTAFARIYDEAHNDRSYNGQSPDGQDLGPVQKKNPKYNPKNPKGQPPTVNGDVAWGSLDEMGKAISVLEDGSLENIQNQLLGSHKVPNFYNNILTPNHPGEYVTIDTHAVAAGQLRPLSGKSLEVKQNFGGHGAGGSVISGTDGTYGLYADAYRDAAAELGIQPRQLQSITWEAIRDIFPAKWKTSAANVAKINDLWRDFEQGKASYDETFDKILQARGGKNIDWSAGKRNPVLAEEAEQAGDTGELREHGVPGGQEARRSDGGRGVNAPPGAAGEGLAPGPTAPLRIARRARQPASTIQ